MRLFWQRLRLNLAYLLMEDKYTYRIEVVDDSREVLHVIWSKDKTEYDRQFVVTPRYHNDDRHMTVN